MPLQIKHTIILRYKGLIAIAHITEISKATLERLKRKQPVLQPTQVGMRDGLL